VLDAFAANPDQTLSEIEIADPEDNQRIEDWSRGVTQVHVLDDLLQPVPIGVVGHVHYAGPAFDPQLHASGERARWLEDGRLDFVGRTEKSAFEPKPVDGMQSEEPGNDTEHALAAMLAEVLGISEIGRNDDFFELGGDSILAVQLAARARDAGLGLTARMVFEHPAIRDLAARVDAMGEATEGGDTHHEPMSASGLSPDELAAVTSMWTTQQNGAP
jgi:mycobactin peptide synthetase MbtE